MATVSAKVYEHHKKADGTYSVKICVHHKDQRKFIDTNHYVVKKQLTAKLKIKDNFVNDLIDDQLKGYRKIISELGEKLNFFNVESLRDYLRDKDADVDFIKFCQLHIEQRDSVSITEINSNMLVSYERFLRSRRTMTRIVTEDGQTKEKTIDGLSDSGLHNHMRDLRTLFMPPVICIITKTLAYTGSSITRLKSTKSAPPHLPRKETTLWMKSGRCGTVLLKREVGQNWQKKSICFPSIYAG